MMISKATVDRDTTEKLAVSPDTEYQDKEISSAITKETYGKLVSVVFLWKGISIMNVCRPVVFVLALSRR